jgi:hypothetical protein
MDQFDPFNPFDHADLFFYPLPEASPAPELAQASPPPPEPEMSLPPPAIYPSKEALFEAIQSWARPHGYAFIISHSKRMEGSGRQRVHFACNRCIAPPTSSSSPQIRRIQSRGTRCLFSVLGFKTINKLSWELKHQPKAKYSTHNHAPSDIPTTHRSHCQL